MRRIFLSLSLAFLLGGTFGASGTASAATSGEAIVQTAMQYLGYAYTTEGNSPSEGFSCIGFVSYVYQSNGINLPDGLGGAMDFAPQIPFADLQPGDVLYFQNTVWDGLSHTGIYIGGGKFINAEWYNRGVVISSFTNDPVDGNYWTEHYLGANRPWAVSTAPAASALSAAPPVQASTGATSTPPAAAPRPAPAPLRTGPRAHVQVLGLHVRLRPSLDAPIKRMVLQGTKLVVLKQYGAWDWVQLPNRSYGWVAGTGIGVPGTRTRATATRLASSSLPLVTPTVNGLRIHTRPALAASVVSNVYRGQKLLMLQSWNGWDRIVLPNGVRGWAYGSYLHAGTNPASHSKARSSTPVAHAVTRAHTPVHVGGRKLTATVRIHSRPGLSAPVLGLGARGAHVRVLRWWHAWRYVRLPSGRGGWVYGSYVRSV